jgi:glycine cleavage system H protein
VLAVNETLSEHPESINADAFAAWLFRLQPLDPGATQRLLDAATYASDIAQHK